MAERRKFSISRLARSFTFAGKGLRWVWKSEPNFRVHCATAILVVTFGFLLQISRQEWGAIALCIGMVLAAETLNSALEVLADAVHPEEHPLIGKAKDASAGAVLLVSLAAGVVGAIIFCPKIWQMIG